MTQVHWPRIYDGGTQPPPKRTFLRAGSLTVAYEKGMLRYIKAGAVEVVRGVYAAVRDHNWGTVPFTLADEVIDDRGDNFTVTFTSIHRQAGIEYVWRGTITGTDESIITFLFDGEARTAFARNRIGFCVLHPADAAGAPLTVEHNDGTTEDGAFPRAIAPHQPYFDIRALTHTPAPGMRVEVRMGGDAFEMEDQRNWTDASFKTYCTPLARPFPVTVQPGDRVRQAVTVRLYADGPIAAVEGDAEVVLTLDTSGRMLKGGGELGLCKASHGEALTKKQIARLHTLRLTHLRVDVRADAPDLAASLLRAWDEARAIGAQRLQIACTVGTIDPEGDLTHLHNLLNASPIQAWVLILQDGASVTPDSIIAASLRIFSRNLHRFLIMVGTDGYFTQLNRAVPQADTHIAIAAYSVNPQVHAFDSDSLIETLPMLTETANAARAGNHLSEVAVTPVTLKIRNNPDATAPEAPTPPGQLPRRVDPRQMSLFGAGWTLGAIQALYAANAWITLYETTGWLGVMERESGSPLPDLFPSIPDAVYPVWHVLADVRAFRNTTFMATPSSHPLKVTGLGLHSYGRQTQFAFMRILIANHTHQRQTVTVRGISGTWRGASLDEHTAEFAMREPEAWRAQLPLTFTADANGAIRVELLPYALLRLVNTP